MDSSFFTSTVEISSVDLEFGKSTALRWLAPRLLTATVPPLLTTLIAAWHADRAGFLLSCNRRFGDHVVAVRSDAHVEDGLGASRAGEFLSVLNVSHAYLSSAVDQVARSLPGHSEDRIIVQAMVQRVRFAGVASTHRITDGAPWYCLDLAPLDSAAVTSGRAAVRQVSVARKDAQRAATLNLLTEPENLVLNALMEVERLAGHRAIEIEFAVGDGANGGLETFLLQVRPITTTAGWNRVTSESSPRLPSLDFLNEPDPRHEIVGQRTLLSLMSDWNPAELIGAHPRPLALSLFEMLITRGIWWQARADLGYADAPAPDINLLQVLHGRPLVDVRRSANSFLPRGLHAATARELVDGWIMQLAEQPALHDKVEFQVFCTVRDFSTDDELRRDWAAGLSQSAWQEWVRALGELSRTITDIGTQSPLAAHLCIIERLDRQKIIGRTWPELLAISQQGTRAFAALARIAFAAESQLRSAVRRGALTLDRAVALCAAGRSSPVHRSSGTVAAGFIARHGHLRPGTFDITQRTWLASAYQPVGNYIATPAPFCLRSSERAALKSLLHEAGFLLCPDTWIQFVQQSAGAREWGKFVFSRYLSGAMDGIADVLSHSGLDHDCASWLTVEQVLQGQLVGGKERACFWRKHARDAQVRHEAEATLILSPILCSNADRVVANSMGILPNFVGQRVTEGPIVVLEDAHAKPDSALHKAIVVLCRADPGFDWLFDSGIAGLITAWGGANSHLAIRCAEFGLSAAIGCGDAVFAKAALAHHARIDPAGGALWLT